ncbi:MAG: hypothetical protein GQ574_19510 [Crocinitomix sp.]|nr:hypothetical protein [Crocinitomix sp.]
MKNIICILFLFSLVSNQSFAEESEGCYRPLGPPLKNSFSFNILGTGSYIGFSYERLIKQRLNLEVGFGLVGVGAGVTIYPFGIDPYGGISPYIGIKTTFNTMGSGGEKNMTYIPIGITYFTDKKMAFGIDFGPSYQTNFSPFGKVTEETAATFPNAQISIYGNLKISYRF